MTLAATRVSRAHASAEKANREQASLTELGYLFVGAPATVDPATCGADASAGN